MKPSFMMREISLIAFFMLICGGVSIFYGLDLSWDLSNYHYYNPYALLNGRIDLDYWPPSFPHRYFVPTADLLSYFLITFFTPKATIFLMGAIQGLNFYILFHIASMFTKDFPSLFIPLLLALLGLYAPIVFPEIGGFKNDNLISIFILIFVYLQLNALACFDRTPFKYKNSYACLAGVSVGIAIGLKMTAAIFFLAGIFSTLLLPFRWQQKIKLVFMLGISAFISYLLIAGYWLWTIWIHFHNPFYPFFVRGISIASGYSICAPAGFFSKIFYPFYFSLYGSCDGKFIDFRFSMAYLLILWIGITYLYATLKKKVINPLSNKIYWFLLFFIFSYVINAYCFAGLRYIVALEMLAPVLIYVLLDMTTSKVEIKFSLLVIATFFLLCTMKPILPSRVSLYTNDYFDVRLPTLVKDVPNASVLIAYPAYAMNLDPRPLAYLIPFFPPKWQFIGIPFTKRKFVLTDDSIRTQIAKKIAQQQGNFYLLTVETQIRELKKAARSFGLLPVGKCEDVESRRQTIINLKAVLCPAIKL